MLIFIAILVGLTLFHPMLRSVEPQVINYNLVEFGIDTGDDSILLKRALIANATVAAFALWEEYNPNLSFKESEDGMTVVFMPLWHVLDGFALCPFWSNSEDGYYILISSNVLDTYGYPINKNIMANALAHETGHILGIMHTEQKDHLMSGSVFGWQFEDRGFAVPEPLDLLD